MWIQQSCLICTNFTNPVTARAVAQEQNQQKTNKQTKIQRRKLSIKANLCFLSKVASAVCVSESSFIHEWLLCVLLCVEGAQSSS